MPSAVTMKSYNPVEEFRTDCMVNLNLNILNTVRRNNKEKVNPQRRLTNKY